MIAVKTFSQFLEEGRLAPLYHGTALFNGLDILLRGEILPKTNQPVRMMGVPPIRKRGISLTRNYTYAAEFGRMDHFMVFELDQNKLTQRFKVVPFNYFYHDREEFLPNAIAARQQYDRSAKLIYSKHGTESEEFVFTDKGIPITYVKGIYTSALKGEIEKEMELMHYRAKDKEIIRKFFNMMEFNVGNSLPRG